MSNNKSESNKNSIKNLLDTTFHIKEGKTIPIIKNFTEIGHLIEFLGEEKNLLKEKMELISILISLFTENKVLIPYLVCNQKNNCDLFYQLLINLYLKENLENENRKKIDELFKLIFKNVSVPKKAIEYIFQKLSKYFIDENEIKLLKENNLLHYLNLLEIFYKEIFTEDDNEKIEPKKENNDITPSPIKVIKIGESDINKYMYFNGVGSSLSFSVNNSSIILNGNYPSLDNGCSLVFWLYMDEKITQNYFLINKNIEINLISLNLGKKLKLVFKYPKTFYFMIDNTLIGKEEVSNSFFYNSWNNIGLLISPKSMRGICTVTLLINGEGENNSLNLPKDLSFSEHIKEIKLFENFLGRVSSILFFAFCIDTKVINYFVKKYRQGLYRNKLVFKYLSINDKDYFKNSINYKYYQKSKVNNVEPKLFNILAKKQNIKILMGLFSPFAYNKNENSIDDIFGNFVAKLGDNDGVNGNFIYTNSLELFGGINNLLPIAELLYKNKSLITEKIFVQFLTIIKIILVSNPKNISYANTEKFFSSLGLFMEKYPSNIFTEKVLNILIEIAKESFTIKDVEFSSSQDNFVNVILLNEKIISKFSNENQTKLWKEVYDFFKSSISKIKDSINISKIILLLRFYDVKRYDEYCCQNHASLFTILSNDEKQKNTNKSNDQKAKIMNPEMNKKVEKLFDIIQLYIDNSTEDNDIANLLKLLSLDLSPCLQKKLIQVFISHLDNKKIDLFNRTKTINNLTKNNFFEICEYVLSISLLDVRIEILKLLKIVFQFYTYSVKEYFHGKKTMTRFNTIANLNQGNLHSIIANNNNNNVPMNQNNNNDLSQENFFQFIGGNLLPENLMIEIDNNLCVKETYPLVDYFNKKCYEEDITYLWKLLNEWILSPDTSQGSFGAGKPKNLLKINNYVVDFCILFVSCMIPIYYVNSFLITISSFLSNQTIKNKNVIYDNQNLFSWITETIFYFNNKENIKGSEKDETIESIQKHSLEIFIELLSCKKLSEPQEIKINYVFEYSFYLKKMYKKEPEKIKETLRITRILLEKIMEFTNENDLNINMKSKICFDFMLFFNLNEENITTIDDYVPYSDEGSNKKEGKSNSNNSSSILNQYIKRLKSDNTIFPDIFYDGINLDENNLSKKPKTTPEKKKDFSTLESIWKDYNLFKRIISLYQHSLWGLANMCKKVKVETRGKFLMIYRKLLGEYGENKKYKNILAKELYDYLEISSMNSSNSTTVVSNNMIGNTAPLSRLNSNASISSVNCVSDNYSMNILTLNAILICLAIDITTDNEEKNRLEEILEQLLIFCILANINISSSDKNYKIIQNKLYETLCFCCLFYKEKKKNKFKTLIVSFIKPIFWEVGQGKSKKGIKGLFGKKNIFKNTALFKLFDFKNNAKKKGKLENIDDDEDNDELNCTMYNFRSKDNKALPKKELPMCGLNYMDDSNISEKDVEIDIQNDASDKLQGIFENLIFDYKNERGQSIDIIKVFYKNINKIYKLPNNIVEEKERINNSIKKLIPSFYCDINKYSNNTFLREKERKNNYKKTKKNLFSWRGFWRNRYIFDERQDLLKLKKKNHYSKEMVQPLLVPVLDINYYFPDFKKFDKSKLFNKNNYNYRINLDIDEIFSEVKNNETKNKGKRNTIFSRNMYGFNYLECIYKMPYNGLWEQYKYYYEQILDSGKTLKNEIPPAFMLDKDENEENKNNNNNNNVDNNDINNPNFRSTITTKNEKKICFENKYNCCIVKITHHIKGLLYTEKNGIKFTYDFNENNKNITELENDPNYDKDMGSCFGSIFKKHKKDKDLINLQIIYPDIKYMFVRHYFYNESGLEIFTTQNKSYFINFRNSNELTNFIDDILHYGSFREIKTEVSKVKKILGYEKISATAKKKPYSIYHKMEEWQNYGISTLEYLMWLNIYAGRSFNDLTQYPVFPWIISNYTAKELTSSSDFRDLSLPMGMMNTNEKSEVRIETFIDTYESIKNDLKEVAPYFNYQEYLKKGEEYFGSFKIKKSKRKKTMSHEEGMNNSESNQSSIQINQVPYFYGSHYSNPTYITNFLSRTFPYSFVSIEIQGEKFDDPDRLFLSIQKTFESASSLKDDIRELIPEFYTMPEVFKNINNLDLSQGHVDFEGKEVKINDVDLPLWSNNDPSTFITKKRRNLENNNLKLCKWIDLIFGSCQRGEKAEEKKNIFMAHTYERMVKIDKIDNIDSRNALMRLVEIGVTPFQLFDFDAKQKIERNQFFSKSNVYSLSTDKFLVESSKLFIKLFKTNKLSNIANKENKKISFPKISKILWIGQNNLRIITNTNYYYNIRYTKIDEKIVCEESNPNEIENNSSKYASSYLLSSITPPIIVYNNNKNILKGGFWDGRIEVNSMPNTSKEEVISTSLFPECGPITVMEMVKNEEFLLCGTKIGIVLIFKVKDKYFHLEKKIFLHNDEITSISINENLNMFSSSSKDGYIMLYTLPTFKLVRSIKIKLKNNNEKGNNDIIYADNVFLSNFPIACICIYISQKKLFKTYTINGLEMSETNEDKSSTYIKCPIIFTSLNFQDYLIYGTDDGNVKIRKFPEMKQKYCINFLKNEPIQALTLSPDKRFCFVWGKEDQIGIIKGEGVPDSQIKENIALMGFSIK